MLEVFEALLVLLVAGLSSEVRDAPFRGRNFFSNFVAAD
jgi:hypothetical protein